MLTKQPDRPICSMCGEKPCKTNGKSKLGFTLYKKECGRCHKKKTSYREVKKDYCESCGMIPVHPVQLDVDHIDGDHSNNEPDNLQTLCANCHRLKTFIQRHCK